MASSRVVTTSRPLACPSLPSPYYVTLLAQAPAQPALSSKTEIVHAKPRLGASVTFGVAWLTVAQQLLWLLMRWHGPRVLFVLAERADRLPCGPCCEEESSWWGRGWAWALRELTRLGLVVGAQAVPLFLGALEAAARVARALSSAAGILFRGVGRGLRRLGRCGRVLASRASREQAQPLTAKAAADPSMAVAVAPPVIPLVAGRFVLVPRGAERDE